MSMPKDLILVRHGESVGNVAMHAERSGDSSLFTDAFATTPGHRWAITATGIAQAMVAGVWLREEFELQDEGHLTRYYVSPVPADPTDGRTSQPVSPLTPRGWCVGEPVVGTVAPQSGLS